MKNYVEIITVFEPDVSDIISAYLWELEPSGIEELDSTLRLFFDDETAAETKAHEIEVVLAQLKAQHLLTDFHVSWRLLPLQNWNEDWQQSLQVIRVTDRILIKPTFRDYSANENEIVITIDPKMSFGTGEHATTKLMLSALQKWISPGVTVLDVGSGTAVLAIASVLLGAEKATAVDNDDLCYDNAVENSELNGVQDKVVVVTGTISCAPEPAYDLLAANIQKNVLLSIASMIFSHTRSGGFILLSGLLYTDEVDILRKYSPHCELLEKTQMDEWICLVFKKR